MCAKLTEFGLSLAAEGERFVRETEMTEETELSAPSGWGRKKRMG